MKKGDKIEQRAAFGEALCELGDIYPKLVVFDADVCASTQTIGFKKKYPERFYEMGIAEANMVCAAAGMAATGWTPFVSTFAVFLASRAGDQIRISVAYPKLNVKFNGAYGGLPTGKAGATHSAIEDLAIMRAMPNMTILVPADPLETKLAAALAMGIDGPVYLRTVRCAVPVIFDSSHTMELGRAAILHEGADIAIVSTGMMSVKALQAAERLKKEHGIGARVVHMGTLKPLDKAAVVAASRDFGRILTVENHSVIGGLGSAVAETLAEEAPCRMRRLGFQDVFAESGDDEATFSKLGMNVENIVAAARDMLSAKK